jgi:hypothetical protein
VLACACLRRLLLRVRDLIVKVTQNITQYNIENNGNVVGVGDHATMTNEVA